MVTLSPLPLPPARPPLHDDPVGEIGEGAEGRVVQLVASDRDGAEVPLPALRVHALGDAARRPVHHVHLRMRMRMRDANNRDSVFSLVWTQSPHPYGQY